MTSNHTDKMSGWSQAISRGIDILISGVTLILFFPLFLICFILIKREDGGKVIYAQERIGKGGRPFLIYKFRTMYEGAENGEPQLSPTQRNDPRLLKSGRFLRDHHLDELPQLWNVFIGDMAFVGPRPERPYYIRQIMKHDPRYERLYAVRPGVTSYATLYNGYTDTMEKMLRRLELDLYYLDNRSLLLNLKILWLTFYRIAIGRIF